MNTKLTIDGKPLNPDSRFLSEKISEDELTKLAQNALAQEAQKERDLSCKVLSEMK